MANFAQTTHSITLLSNPTSGGTVQGGGDYFAGLDATVIATANTNWKFIKWTAGSTTVSTNSVYTFTVNSNRTLVASFTPIIDGIDELGNEKDLQILPNPSNGNFTIIATPELILENVEIFDVLGKKVNSIQFSNPPYLVNATTLPKGNYVLKLRAKSDKIYVKRIIIL